MEGIRISLESYNTSVARANRSFFSSKKFQMKFLSVEPEKDVPAIGTTK